MANKNKYKDLPDEIIKELKAAKAYLRRHKIKVTEQNIGEGFYLQNAQGVIISVNDINQLLIFVERMKPKKVTSLVADATKMFWK